MGMIWRGLGIFVGVLAFVAAIFALLRHERASGFKEGRAAAEAAQVASNAKADTEAAQAVTVAVEHHQQAVVYIERQAEEAVHAIEDASDLDGALSAWAVGIDTTPGRVRPQAPAEPDKR